MTLISTYFHTIIGNPPTSHTRLRALALTYMLLISQQQWMGLVYSACDDVKK